MNENDAALDVVDLIEDVQIDNDDDNQVNVNENENDGVGEEDDFDPHAPEPDDILPVVLALRDGRPALLEGLLQEGADPNTSHDVFGSCLMVASCFGQSECARLLLEHDADVSYTHPTLINATIMHMMVNIFRTLDAEAYRQGDYILTADLLIHAGAPSNVRPDGNGEENEPTGLLALTPLEVLQQMPVNPGTKAARERDGLLSLLRREYWREWGNKNPFLCAAKTEDMVWLFMKGAANERGNPAGSIDCTRVRSVPPKQRRPVLKALNRHKESFHAFMNILFVVQDKANSSGNPLRLFHGVQDSVLAKVAEFAGLSGEYLVNARATVISLVQILNVAGDIMDYDEDDA